MLPWAAAASWRFRISDTGAYAFPSSAAVAPNTKAFPHAWYESPNIHSLTVDDSALIEKLVVERRYFLSGHRKVLPSLPAETGVYLVSRGK
jgi:hypothetical protein